MARSSSTSQTSHNPQAVRSLERIEFYARLMDSQFRVPGTNFRFGLDPLLGLIPFAGDTVSFLLQGALLLTMVRHRASGKVAVLMTLNVVLDYIIGNIPIIGNVLDFFYKSSDKNLRLLKRHYTEGKYQGSGTGIILLIIVIMALIFALVGFLVFKFFQWLVGMF